MTPVTRLPSNVGGRKLCILCIDITSGLWSVSSAGGLAISPWSYGIVVHVHCTRVTVILHYRDVIMSAMASQITSLTIVCSTVYSVADQRKHRSSASLAFMRGIHRWPVNTPHKGPVTRKMVTFDDVIMHAFASRELVGVSPTFGKRVALYVASFTVPSCSIWVKIIDFSASVTLEFDGWPTKPNRTPFLCDFKLCALFRSPIWIQTGVTMRGI